jgi:4-hydroxybenzoate polyprenyltransferase
MTPSIALRLARPEHWIKNVLVFFPVVLSQNMGSPPAWLQAAVAAAALCLISSATYVVNDIRDRAADRLHPIKKNRPLASGRVGPRAAMVEAVVLLVAALAVAWTRRIELVGIIAAYFLLQLAYSLLLKRKMLLDAICIALGFVLRAAAGAVAIGVQISPWLFICTFTLCLFLAFCKRRNESAALHDAATAEEHRRTLGGYTPELLTHLITLSAAIAVVAFLVYALSDRTVERFQTNYLVYTLPLVIYGIFRLAMLSMFGRYADPTDLALRDRPFQLVIVIWVVAVIVIIRFGPDLREWLVASP